MNAFERFEKVIRTVLPDCDIIRDVPTNPKGQHILDMAYHGHEVAVVWEPGKGFGIQADPQALPLEPPHEYYLDPESAAIRVLTLLMCRLTTHPPRATLKEVRTARGVSQQELALKLGTSQGAVSKVESRGREVQVDTLSRAVEALGGRLYIRLRFPDGMERELSFEEAADEAAFA